MWGRGKGGDRPTELQQRAGEAEKLILAMPEADRAAVLAAVERMAGQAAIALASRSGCRSARPPDLQIHSGAALPAVRKPSPEALVRQVVAGAPTLLGPHRAAIERLLGATADA